MGANMKLRGLSCAGGLMLMLLAAPARAATLSHTEPSPLTERDTPVSVGGGFLSSAPGGSLVVYRNEGIAARVLDEGGSPLDKPFYLRPNPTPTRVEEGYPLSQGRPMIVSDGTSYVAAWTEGYRDSMPFLVSRIDAQGQPVPGVEWKQVSPQYYYALLGQSLVASPGGSLLFACGTNARGPWEFGFSDVKAVCQSWAFDHANSLTGESLLTVPLTTQSVALVSIGTASLALLEDHGTLSRLLLDESGAFVDSTPVPLAAGTSATASGIDGGFAVVWLDGDKLRRGFVATDGTAQLAPDALVENVTLAGPPRLLATPIGFALLTLEGDQELVLRQFSATWEALSAPQTLGIANTYDYGLWLSANQASVIATWSASNAGLVSRSVPLDEPDSAGALVGVSWTAPQQKTPRTLHLSDGWAVLWSEGAVLRGAKVDDRGKVKGPISTWIFPEQPYSDLRLLDVARQSTRFAVVGRYASGEVLAARIDDTFELESLQDLPRSEPRGVVVSGLHSYIGLVDHSSDDYVVSVRSDAGDTVQIASLSALPAGSSSVPFDLVTIDGGYRAWWADEEGHVRAKDVKGDIVSDGPDFSAPPSSPTFLTARAASVLAGSAQGAFFKSGSSGWVGTPGSSFSELVDVYGSTGVVTRDVEGLTVNLAAPNQRFEPLDSFDVGDEPSLSELVGDRMLLAFTRTENVGGVDVSRVYVSMLTGTDLTTTDDGQGGAGGASATGDGGATTENAAGASGDGATDSAGGAPNEPDASGGSADDLAAGASSDVPRPRSASGCGCRVAGHSSTSHLVGLTALIGIAWARRRRATT